MSEVGVGVERARSRALSLGDGLAVIALIFLAVIPATWRDQRSPGWHAAGVGGFGAIVLFMSLRFGSKAPTSRALLWAASWGVIAGAVVWAWQVVHGHP